MEIKTIFNYVVGYIDITLKVFWIYFIWIFMYYIASHLHIYCCLPPTISGFLMSPFMTATPHCQALRWIIYNGGNSIVTMWLLMGAWLLQYIKPITS